MDVDGLSRNPNPLDEDLTGTRWHGDCDRKAVSGWHVATYPTLFFGAFVEIPIHGLDDETDWPQVIAYIWEDQPVLHKLQHGTFFLFISAMERYRIGHQITRLCWKNGLLF